MATLVLLVEPVSGEKTLQGWVKGGMGLSESQLGLVTKASISEGRALGKQPTPLGP